MKRDYHVVPAVDGWNVKAENSKRASAHTESKQEAIDKAKFLAKKSRGEVVIHTRDESHKR